MDGFPDERVHRYNAEGLAGLANRTVPQRPRRLAPDQLAALVGWVEVGPDLARDGVVRWRRRDLARTASRPSSASSCTSAASAKQLAALGFRRLQVAPAAAEVGPASAGGD